jgi:hypothetical protein
MRAFASGVVRIVWSARVLRDVYAACAACVAATSACSTPSSSVDGGDLLGVFERDAGGDAIDGGLDGGGKRDAGADASDAPSDAAAIRPPTEGSCVAVAGQSGRELRRILGRPACRGAQVLEWRDAEGSPRYACAIAPSGVETRAPLPLIVFFHAEGDDPTSVDRRTGLRKLAAKVNLTGDPAHAGFLVLALQGQQPERA